MRNTVKKATNSFRLSKIVKGIRDPELAKSHARSIIATARKEMMDMDAERSELSSRLASCLGMSEDELRAYQEEIEKQSPFKEEFEHRLSQLDDDPDVQAAATSRLDCHTIYVLCRAVKPETVVLTGARYGAIDAHVTHALDTNGTGELHSVDLPNAIEKFDYGYLVPEGYRDRWTMNLGDARNMLDDLLSEVGAVDAFIHDSLHTVDHMKWEYETAYPHLCEGGVLVSHDVLKSSVFRSFAEENGMPHTRVRNVGIAQS